MEGRSVGARRDRCIVSSGSSSIIIYSTSVALVWSAGPLGWLRSNVCVDEDIRNSDKEIHGSWGSRRAPSQRVSRLHGDACCRNPALRNEKSLEIILGPISPAITPSAALQGDRSARDEG